MVFDKTPSIANFTLTEIDDYLEKNISEFRSKSSKIFRSIKANTTEIFDGTIRRTLLKPLNNIDTIEEYNLNITRRMKHNIL